MPNDNLARLRRFPATANRPNALEPLGRVVSVGGSQVMVEFTTAVAVGRRDRAHRRRVPRHLERAQAGRRLAVRHLAAQARRRPAERARHRPRRSPRRARPRQARRRLFPARRHGLSAGSAARSCRSAMTRCASFSTRSGRTPSMSGTCSRTLRSAPTSTSTTWCASTSRSSARPAPASRARSRCMLREIMAAREHLRILLIDPHNEYAACFEDRAHVVRPGNLRLPYWLFNFDEMQRDHLRPPHRRRGRDRAAGGADPARQERICAQAAANPTSYRKSSREGGRYTVDTPVPYRMDDLVAIAEARMGKLENRAVAGQYRRLHLAHPVGAQESALRLHLRRRRRRHRHHGRHPVRAAAARKTTASR